MLGGDNSSVLFDLLFVLVGILINAVMFYNMVWKNYTTERLMGPTGPQGVRGDIGERGPRGPQGNRASRGAKGPRGPAGDPGDSAECWSKSLARQCTSDWSSMGLTRKEDIDKGCLFGYTSKARANDNQTIDCIPPSGHETKNCKYERNTGIRKNRDPLGWGDSNDILFEKKFNAWKKKMISDECPGVPKEMSKKYWDIKNN